MTQSRITKPREEVFRPPGICFVIRDFVIRNFFPSPQHFDRPIMLPAVDDTRNLLGLLAVFAQHTEFMLAVFAVPDAELPAEEHRDANFTGVGGDGVSGHRNRG